jgi:DNA-binding NtrC family response regulator
MSGLDLLKQVLYQAPRTIRVLFSGHAEMSSASGEAAGIIALFISKPWDDARLIADVRALLKQRDPLPSES